jgi:hypothetical protein
MPLSWAQGRHAPRRCNWDDAVVLSWGPLYLGQRRHLELEDIMLEATLLSWAQGRRAQDDAVISRSSSSFWGRRCRV